jgi:thymidylate kinase
MKRITYLRTVYGMLHGGLPGRPHAVILDEGPVYMLARLRVYGAERIRTAAFERWWRGTVAQWARTVDLIVWLDAPDTILLQRSRTRAQVHQLQRLSEARAQQFLASYREAYETVVRALTELGGPTVLRVRSDQQSLEAIRDQTLGELTRIAARRSR